MATAATGTDLMAALGLLDPTGAVRITARNLAPRLPSLQGKVIGFIDNGKLNVVPLFAALALLLKERYGVADTVTVRKPSASRPVAPEVLKAMASRCHAIVAGVGD